MEELPSAKNRTCLVGGWLRLIRNWCRRVRRVVVFQVKFQEHGQIEQENDEPTFSSQCRYICQVSAAVIYIFLPPLLRPNCRQTRVKINRSKGEIGRRVFGWMPPRPIAIRCYVCSVQTQYRRVHHCIIQDICTYSREKKRLSRSPLLFSLEGGEQETRGCSAFSYRDGQSFGIDRWTILHQHGWARPEHKKNTSGRRIPNHFESIQSNLVHSTCCRRL